MKGDFDRARLIKLLGLLGSAHDGEVLNAARLIDAMARASGSGWDDLLAPAGPKGFPKTNPDQRADLDRLDALLSSGKVSDVLKLRLSALRHEIKTGRAADRDRHLLRMLHRKAIIEGVLVTE